MARRPPPSPERILAWRESLGLTQEQAAEILGVSRRSYGSYERGERRPRPYLELGLRWVEWLHSAR